MPVALRNYNQSLKVPGHHRPPTDPLHDAELAAGDRLD